MCCLYWSISVAWFCRLKRTSGISHELAENWKFNATVAPIKNFLFLCESVFFHMLLFLEIKEEMWCFDRMVICCRLALPQVASALYTSDEPGYGHASHLAQA